MFTGIIETIGSVETVISREGGKVFGVRVPFKPVLGESIALSGACLTVSGLFKEGFYCFVSPETLKRTTFGSVKPGSNLHVERALPVDGRLGGHIVLGHIDAVGKVVSSEKSGDTIILEIQVPGLLRRFLVEKGSIAVDGVSLTVNNIKVDVFYVTLVPFTLKLTLLGRLEAGSGVNLEVDMISKLVVQTVERILGKQTGETGEDKEGVTADLLLKAGFIKYDGK